MYAYKLHAQGLSLCGVEDLWPPAMNILSKCVPSLRGVEATRQHRRYKKRILKTLRVVSCAAHMASHVSPLALFVVDAHTIEIAWQSEHFSSPKPCCAHRLTSYPNASFLTHMHVPRQHASPLPTCQPPPAHGRATSRRPQ